MREKVSGRSSFSVVAVPWLEQSLWARGARGDTTWRAQLVLEILKGEQADLEV